MSVLLAAANCKLVCCRTIKDHVGRALCLLSDVTRRRYLSATRLKGPRGLGLLYGLRQLRLPHAEEGLRK